jgi:chromosome partitioning protein
VGSGIAVMVVRLAIANHKGGVAKSTTTMMIAEGLAHFGRLRVLVIDMDPQCSVSTMLLSKDGADHQAGQGRSTLTMLRKIAANEPVQISKFITSKASDIIELRDAHGHRRVDLIASDRKLLTCIEELQAQISASLSSDLAARISSELKRIEKSYDIIIFDCPANAGTLTLAAIRLAHYVISPTVLDHVSITALRDFIAIILDKGATGNFQFKVLPTIFRSGDPEQRLMLDRIRSGVTGLDAFTHPIPDTVYIRRAVNRIRPTSYRDLNEKYAGAVPDLRALVAAVLKFTQLTEANE